MRLKLGEPCPVCGTEVVRITRDTLNQMVETLSPALHSVSRRQLSGRRAHIPICPACDAYALGIEFAEGFPFILKDGRHSEIQQIADLLWQPGKPFRSENLAGGDPGAGAAGGAKIIPFPHYTVPEIDWGELEQIRYERYPRLPAELMPVLKQMMASLPDSKEVASGDYAFEVERYSNDIYPPDPIGLIPGKGCVLWEMDLLDRFGGTVSYGRSSCTIEREEISHPLFRVHRISEEQFSGMNDCLVEYEFYAKNHYWKVFSKDLSAVNLVILIAMDLSDESRIFQGMFDNNTFLVLRERILEGRQGWDEILMLDQAV